MWQLFKVELFGMGVVQIGFHKNESCLVVVFREGVYVRSKTAKFAIFSNLLSH